MKKRVFIASSVEGLPIAYDLQEELEYDFDIVVWSQGVFAPSKTTLDSLFDEIARFDAAIFVFSPDDQIERRGEKGESVRDNVIFELGLFMGSLGRHNCFIVQPINLGKLAFPSDLFGVTPATFNSERDDGDLRAAIGPACNKIRKALGDPKYVKPSRISKDTNLQDILLRGRFRLFFSPLGKGGSKQILFGEGGAIVEGNNRNEHRWRIKDGKLELINLDGAVFSRFAYDHEAQRFDLTNEADLLAKKDQYIIFDN